MFIEQELMDDSAESTREVEEVFNDFEARSNIVGLFDQLLKIDMRVNPHLYND
jgi:hypothetical protein